MTSSTLTKVPRGFVDLRIMQALAVAFPIVIAASVLCSHVLHDRDTARADRDAAEERENVCLWQWGRTVDRASVLRAELAEVKAAADEMVCSCWVPDEVAP